MWGKIIIAVLFITAFVWSYEYAPFVAPPTSAPVADISPNPSSFPESASLPPANSESSPSSSNLFSESLKDLIPDQNSPVVETDVPDFVSPPPTEPNPAPPVDSKLVFERLWPDYYRASLTQLEELMITNGRGSASARSSFDSDSAIFSFLDNFAGYYRDIAGLSDAEFQDLLAKFKNSRSLKAEQRQTIIGDLSLLNLLFDLIGLNPPLARASYITGAFCYRDDAPGNFAPGIASPAVSCNSGMWCDSTGCHFRPDCGPYAAACNVQLGCLNLVCGGFANAIFDPTTSMCGCG